MEVNLKVPISSIKNLEEDGFKKYSYYSAGSGPQGSYQKGYYGSEGKLINDVI